MKKSIYKLKKGDKVFYGQLKNGKLTFGETVISDVKENTFCLVRELYTEALKSWGIPMCFSYYYGKDVPHHDDENDYLMPAAYHGKEWDCIIATSMDRVKEFLLGRVDGLIKSNEETIQRAEKSIVTMKQKSKKLWAVQRKLVKL